MVGENLEGKVAIVTGSRRGIGRSIALSLAGSGADVAVCDSVVDDGKLNRVAEEIHRLGRQSLAIQVDISRQTQVEDLVQQVLGHFAKINILVNSAGVWIAGQNLLDCTEIDWDKVIDINLKGTYFCCRAVGKVMVKQKGGNIINLSSQVGLNPGIGTGAYSISKAGIIALTRQLALELAEYNIRVNALAPGIIKTDFNIDLWKEATSAKRMANEVPLGRLGESEDIARAALFLASDDSSYITGDVLKIDGGWCNTSLVRPK